MDMDTVMDMEASLLQAFDLTQGWALIKASLREPTTQRAGSMEEGWSHALCCL